ncbi:exonuclease 1-like [Solanum pennellii]|uniref:Exonuclease 1-like n=1 Tax=Solanum pennellii TaxID=28526 RepID=A0ABM1HM15_SOLPN|nr:exonuclease 1-like [Solanum pennellii]
MDSYSYAISSSNNNTSSTYAKEVKKNKKLASYHSSLHGVRRLPLKPMTKLPIAPLPPTPPKIYRVEPNDFKDVVQMLTSSPEFQTVSNDSISRSDSGSGFDSGSGCSSGSSSFNSRRLQDIAPPPLDLSPVSLQRSNNNNNNNNNNNDDYVLEQWREYLLPSSSTNNQFEMCVDSTTFEAQERSHVMSRIPSENYFGSCSPLANFPLSPASFAWCSSILFSPGTLTSPSAVQII